MDRAARQSGLDASPQFDPICASGPVCCEVMTNVLYSLSRLALGKPSLTPVIVERMYDQHRGLFWPLVQPGKRCRPVVTWAALSPLALPDLPEDIGHRLVQQHVLDSSQFWLPFPPPSVSASERAFSAEDAPAGLHRLRRYWRGPIWINAAWLIWLGLLRLGYEEEAAQLAERIAGAVSREGLREYYQPFTGRGMGALDFGWSALVLEMVRQDPAAARSYIDA